MSRPPAPKNQCDRVGMFNGANCCWLEKGHEGDHVNAFGHSFPDSKAGTSDAVGEYLASFYYQPEALKRTR